MVAVLRSINMGGHRALRPSVLARTSRAELAGAAARQRPSVETVAFARPYPGQGRCVTALMDRQKDDARRNPDSTGILLGHVLAHEIGHLLQDRAALGSGDDERAMSQREIAACESGTGSRK